MSDGRLSKAEFVARLVELFEQSKEDHSVYITQKPYEDEEGSSSGPSILLRANDGRADKKKRVKFSTVIPAAEVNDFFAQHYLPQLRSALTSATLRKRDKAKERRTAKMLAVLKERRDRNGGVEPVQGVGSIRGAGHRKRQRAQRRAARLRSEQGKDGGAAAGSSAPAQLEADTIMIDA